ncbi:hypothetical protein BHE74_00008215 [Ensete ventricosum]|nr:hypothetical protein BHE74_00008215 [Ensete ventricosum]
MCLRMLLFGGSDGVLHEGLVMVGAPDVAPPMIKSVLQLRWSKCSESKESFCVRAPSMPYPGVAFILARWRSNVPWSFILSVSFAEVTYGLTWSQGPRAPCLHLMIPCAGFMLLLRHVDRNLH